METLRVVRAALMRPIIGEADGQKTVGLEVVEGSGERFVIALSGEGLKGLATDIQSFLDEDQELAEIKSPSRQ
jgi:hypothetical protein